MGTNTELIGRIRPHVDLSGEVVWVSLDRLRELIPEFSVDEIVVSLVQLHGVTITDSRLGGVCIPRHYFD